MLLASLAVGRPALAVPEEDWLDRSALTGDWGGWRTDLRTRGVTPFAFYVCGFWSNVRGGFEKGTRYEGFARWGVSLDLETLVGWRGADFRVAWHSYHGKQPSAELVGQATGTELSGYEGELSIRFFDIYLEQTLFDGRIVAKLGQIAADDDFGDARYSEMLLGAGFGTLPLERDTEILPIYPVAAPGIFVFAQLSDRWFARAGAYTADSGPDETRNYGFAWSFKEGASFAGEVGTDQAPFGLPGRFSVAGVATTRNLVDRSTGDELPGGFGVLVTAAQALIRDDSDDVRLGAFLSWTYVPTSNRAIVRSYLEAGFEVARPLPGRDRDAFAVGVSYVTFGSEYVESQRKGGINASRRQFSFEITYQARLAGWLTLQPDLQVFFDPHLSRKDAVALGLRAVIYF